MSENTETLKKTKCYHCGEVCNSQTLEFENKKFCCSGCKTVYEILESNSLCTYYNLESSPGINPGSIESGKFDFLDENEIIDKLLDFKIGNLAKIRFFIPQMHCASCIWLLEKLYKLNSEIRQSTVNFPKKTLTVQFNIENLSLKNLVILLSSLGYEPSLSLAETNKVKQNHHNRKLYLQVGVAGFCFGNIMLFSMPEYFDFTKDLGVHFKEYFAYINILLSLPVLFYSDRDYLKSAWGGLRKGIINLDVPLSLGMITLFITSLFEIIGQSGPGYLDSFTGLVFFLLLGKAFQQKTFQTISFERDYKSYFPLYTHKIINGVKRTVSLETIKKGDRIYIRNNDLIPADGVLLKGSAYIDYSFVSGESEPVFKELGEIIYAGGRQTGGALEIETIKDVSNSYLTELWNQSAFKSSDKAELSKLSDKVAKWFTFIILSVAIISSLFYLPEIETSAKIFASILIIACPCALALSIPYTYGNAIRILGKMGFYLKNSDVVEKLADGNFIVFDKTGTLTNSNSEDYEYRGHDLSNEERHLVKSLSSISNHPLSRKLNEIIEGEVLKVNDFKEEIGKGISGIIHSHLVKIGSSKYIGIEQKPGVHISIDHNYKGYFKFSSGLRKEVNEQLLNISEKYDFAVCSGDNDTDKEMLQAVLGKDKDLKFNQSPQMKLDYISKLKKRGKKVIMIGDGLNDAGALKESNVGISITDNTGHFSPASDIIMDSESFKHFDRILDYSKFCVKTVKAGFVLSALYNLTGLAFAVQGLLTPVFAAVLMPLSSVSVVIFATVLTNVKALRIKKIEWK